MKLRILVLAVLLTAPAFAAPAVQPDADDLLAGAGIVEGRAASHDARARAALDRATRLDDDAKDLRGRSIARAEELEIRAAQKRAEATRERAEAGVLRTRASDLRKRAKAIAAAPPSPKRALLNVAARGACDVEVDGVPRGVAPIVGLRVRAGAHVVTCTVRGGAARSRSIEATDGRAVTAELGGVDVADPFVAF
jgi:hypothetical protein